MNTRKIGKNRGTARLWLEGKILESWAKGKRFDVEFKNGQLLYSYNPDGRRKVAGTEDRPIIDTCTNELLTIAAIGETVKVEVTAGFILITKA